MEERKAKERKKNRDRERKKERKTDSYSFKILDSKQQRTKLPETYEANEISCVISSS